MKKVIVPDASVILKWAFNSPDEKHRDKALVLLESWLDGRCEIILPQLWLFEVGNVIGLKNPAMARELLDIFVGYGFAEAGLDSVLCRETLKIMEKCGVTFYDAVYHAVAIIHKGLLVTADEAYYRRTSGLRNILLLENFVEP